MGLGLNDTSTGDGGLNRRILDVMEHVEYRRITASEDFEAIGRLRSQAFDARYIYAKGMANSAVDETDRAPNAYVFGMYYYGELVSTVRIQVVSKEYPTSVSTSLFPSTLKPLIEQGMSFIDPTRLAVDERISHLVPGLPLIMLRTAVMATTYFEADFCLSLVKEGHAPFYRRVFRSTALAGPEQFDLFAFPAVLFASPRQNEADICRRYPLFSYTESERRLMFETPASGALPLVVVPTAKFAAQAA